MLSKIRKSMSWVVYVFAVLFGIVNITNPNNRSVLQWITVWVVFICRALIVLWHTEDEAQEGFTRQQRELYGFQVPYWIERLVFYHGLRGQLILFAGLSAFGFVWAEAAFNSAVGADALLSHFGPSIFQGRPNAGTVPTSIVYALNALVGVWAIRAYPWVSVASGGQFALIWLIVGLLGHFRPTPQYPIRKTT